MAYALFRSVDKSRTESGPVDVRAVVDGKDCGDSNGSVVLSCPAKVDE
jgi:hypothetical protein